MKYLWIAGAVVLAVAVVLTVVKYNGKRNMLAPTIVGAIGAFLLVSGWLFVVDPNAAKNEAIKTGGLAGGSVIALYALWLNDRKRRTEEARQEIEKERQDLENQRAEHDRSRVADERFARAVELLGHDTDQVRVGALHALAGLARSRTEYTQTVLDIVCSYLRRPFELGDEHGDHDEAELQVRRTAQRLIADLLPEVGVVDAPHYEVDLSKATLAFLELTNRQIGRLILRDAEFHYSNSLHHSHVHGDVFLSGSTTKGRLHLLDMVFHGKVSFQVATTDDWVDFRNTRFHGPAKFTRTEFSGPVSFEGAVFDQPVEMSGTKFTGGLDLRTAVPQEATTNAMVVSLNHENRLPDGWVVDQRPDGTGLVRS
ncbi:pentapeptide repeat-containing protein [Umezawaea endophytica]|uniref:Pentapeptide repeat-containing protein n=1 Tax=Umezawaea endophytica TaxID=1654476 RepID=A0A9X3A2P8_9PSEU|nr:pentapeptide repeat-containing protein [Umezawaea endophytica]MCS7480884.1 pentapeptide repeat-containing protein [Umezawaea endophytica]